MNDHERGAAAITVAFAMVLLLAVAALAIDIGLGFDDRRGTQNAADNAALAAAWEACNPRSTPADPEGSALAVAAQNGYDDSDAATTVIVTELDTAVWEVVIETTNDTTFGAPGVGAETVDVTSRAVAECEEEPFLGGYAIFAGAESCSNGGSIELDLTGSTKTILGGIFSNGDLKINGPNTTVVGEVEYRGGFTSNAGVTAEQYFGTPKAYPLDLEYGDFAPPAGSYRSDDNFVDASGNVIDNAWMINHGYAIGNNSRITIIEDGIYFTSNSGNDAIDLSRVSRGIDTDTGALARFTFVSRGSMHITGDGDDLHGYAPVLAGGYSPILFFSEAGTRPSCNTNAIQFSGSSMSWHGLIFAPNGEVQMSASSSDASVNGSIIAHSVNVSGSNFTIEWQDDTSGEPRFSVELQE